VAGTGQGEARLGPMPEKENEDLIALTDPRDRAGEILDNLQRAIVARLEELSKLKQLAAKDQPGLLVEGQAGGASFVLMLSPTPRSRDLTPRQRQYADLIAAGLSNAQVGEQLGVSKHTVAHVLRTIRKKLGLRSSRGISRSLLFACAAADVLRADES
jgi:DNA-binding CsgD family transcriptional regulator